MRVCSYCGRENPDHEGYCSECGTSLDITPEPPLFPDQVAHYRWCGRLGVTVGIVGVVVVLLSTAELFCLPPGTPVRPSCLIPISSALTLVIGLPFALLGFRGGQKLLCLFGVILAFAPWPAATVILTLASKIYGVDVL
jgi:hypothetical protein